MIIYNITFKVDLLIHEEWLNWMKDEHIKGVMGTNCFFNFRFFRILQEDELDGISYCIMYETDNITKLFDYQTDFQKSLQQITKDRFGDNVLSFRTILKEID